MKITAEYIVGLVDGEGCFYTHLLPPSRHPHAKNYTVRHSFFIKLREDDLPLLKGIKKYFGCGHIHIQRDRRKTHRTCYRYDVAAIEDLRGKIIPFFDRYPLRSRKRNDYLLFREIVMMTHKKLHRTTDGLRKIEELKSRMNAGARRVREIRTHGGNAK